MTFFSHRSYFFCLLPVSTVNMVLFVHSFIHSGHFYSDPFKSSTTQRRSRLQQGYCIGVSRRSAQATAGKGHSQGPYVAARSRVEPTTIRLKVIVSTKAPPRPTSYMLIVHCSWLPNMQEVLSSLSTIFDSVNILR